MWIEARISRQYLVYSRIFLPSRPWYNWNLNGRGNVTVPIHGLQSYKALKPLRVGLLGSLATTTRQQRERPKSERLSEQNKNSARSSHFQYISLPLLYENDVRFPNATSYEGQKLKPTNFPPPLYVLSPLIHLW